MFVLRRPLDFHKMTLSMALPNRCETFLETGSVAKVALHIRQWALAAEVYAGRKKDNPVCPAPKPMVFDKESNCFISAGAFLFTDVLPTKPFDGWWLDEENESCL